MALTEKKCMACDNKTPPLTLEQINDLLPQVDGWNLEFEHLVKLFKFNTFKESIDFVNKVAALAESEGHHPEIYINYNKVTIEMWTHAIEALSENDFILAAKINQLITQ